MTLAIGGLLIFALWENAHRQVAAATLQVHGRHYALEVAQTEAQQALGLGKRESLLQGTGMVFTYARTQELCFWMKDMRFAIDMVWVAGDKRVVKVARNVSPRTYPQTYCADAQYVIELQANETVKSHIAKGSQLDF